MAELFGSLFQGIPTTIIPDRVVKDPHRLVEMLASHRVSRIVLVPSLLRVLLDIHGDLKRRLPRLKVWVCSGEPLPVELSQRFQEMMPHSLLLNLYGSSEMSADVTWFDTRKAYGESLTIPIGRPISNTQVYVLDGNLEPVPVGVSGELYVGGAGLARGYLNRPELTARTFIPNRFCDEPESRLYRSGDRVRYLEGGNIEFLGRLDHQVKIRGQRIEMSEIEAALVEHPDVRETVVTVQEQVPDEKRLVAYVILGTDEALSISELRRFLIKKLPEYMVPSAFVLLDALPLTPIGKVDRGALPPPDKTRPHLQSALVPPRTQGEDALADIWAEVLGLAHVGIHDNFFELGGHSLLATRVILRIGDAFQVELPLRSLFENPTIAELSEAIQKARESSTDLRLAAIRPIFRKSYQTKVAVSRSDERSGQKDITKTT